LRREKAVHRFRVRSLLLLGTLAVAAALLALAQRGGAADAPAARPRPAGDASVERALARPASLHFKAMPLAEVAARIAREHGFNVLLDHNALKDRRANEETPLNFDCDGVPLGAGLRFMLGQHDLNFVLPEDTDNVLVITSNDVAKGKLIVRVYKVPELIEPANEFSQVPADSTEIVQMITSVIAPPTWNSNGGTGSIACVGQTLVVSQTEDVQNQIAGLLAALDTSRRQQKTLLGGPPIRIEAPDVQRADEIIRRRLAERVGFQFRKAPLTDVVHWLRRQGIPTLLDSKAITDAGANEATPITLDQREMRLDRELKWLLGEADLGSYVDHGALVITSNEQLKNHLVTVVYPVGDLIYETAGDGPFPAPDTEPDFEPLIDLITSTVAPTSWDSAGGPGSISESRSANAIVFSQTEENHELVARLLEKLRAAKKAREPAAGPIRIDDKMPYSRIYSLPPLPQADRTPPSDADDTRLAEQYVTAIETLIDPGPGGWSGESVYIKAFPGRIAVRQSPAVHRRISDLLDAIRPTEQQPVFGIGAGGAF